MQTVKYEDKFTTTAISTIADLMGSYLKLGTSIFLFSIIYI